VRLVGFIKRNLFFSSPGATTPNGVVFYGPLVGFSLLAYEVS